ncbi:MAG: type II toxin-antitoxin system VapB family antitoxin [Sedimentisphaerales bacterium]|nr:type II toxin-antitoxin system VapB family antitoxin [Sedimentisphaerales bacterium]
MRISVVINDDLMKAALEASGFRTKKQAIEEGLRLLVSARPQENIRSFRGKLRWSGDLDRTRTDR